MTDVNIKIFSVRAFPVYDTEKAGVKIHFTKASSEMKPQWLWNTKNQAGEPVASGLYFYVIYDLNKVALIKGKLVIVR